MRGWDWKFCSILDWFLWQPALIFRCFPKITLSKGHVMNNQDTHFIVMVMKWFQKLRTRIITKEIPRIWGAVNQELLKKTKYIWEIYFGFLNDQIYISYKSQYQRLVLYFYWPLLPWSKCFSYFTVYMNQLGILLKCTCRDSQVNCCLASLGRTLNIRTTYHLSCSIEPFRNL